jgi:hypothetical protein
MNKLYAGRNPIRILMAAFLVVGLSACGSQQELVGDAVAAQQAPGAVAARVVEPVRVTVAQGTEMHVTLSTGVGSE